MILRNGFIFLWYLIIVFVLDCLMLGRVINCFMVVEFKLICCCWFVFLLVCVFLLFVGWVWIVGVWMVSVDSMSKFEINFFIIFFCMLLSVL